ncbi:MAG: hypothetical protein H0X33_06330 [Taibaiella sp.]|nr:hypothetical protein [Taibaiella sp.]
MKRIIPFIPIVAMLVLSLTACNKNNDGTPPNAPGGQLSALINGSSFNSGSHSSTAFLAPDTAHHKQIMVVLGANYIVHSAKDSSLQEIVLTMKNFTGIGTYNIVNTDTGDNVAQYSIGLTPPFLHKAKSGIIKVTGTNYNYVQGTFQFTTDSVTITSGYFNVGIPQ